MSPFPLGSQVAEGIGAFLQSVGSDTKFAGWMTSTRFTELDDQTFVEAWGNGHRKQAQAVLLQLQKQTAERVAELVADPVWVARIRDRLAMLH